MNAQDDMNDDMKSGSEEHLSLGALPIDRLDPKTRQAALTAYLDGVLSPEDALRVTAWLDDNPEALREIEHQRRVWDLLESYADEPVADGFADGVFEAVEIRRETREGTIIRLAWYRRPLVAAAAGMLLALGASFGLNALRGDDAETNVPVTVAFEDLRTLDAVPADLLMDTASLEFLASLDDEHFEAFVEGEYEEEDAG